jgi:ActR/RegA family two-component response regulator
LITEDEQWMALRGFCAQDLPRVIDEYALNAIKASGAPATSFQPDDHHWVLEHAAPSLPEIEKATLRRVALRASGNLSRAAARLGMAPVSLSRWLGRRKPAR